MTQTSLGDGTTRSQMMQILHFELKQLWNLRSMKTIPMVIGVCGAIQEKLEKKICDFYSYYY